MDWHDRPYICTELSCEGRPGFISITNLNRHKREVHNRGTKPRKNFLCPVTECPRGSQTPFKRRENLREHIRRIHNGRCDGITGDDRLRKEKESLQSRIAEQDKRLRELEAKKLKLEIMGCLLES